MTTKLTSIDNIPLPQKYIVVQGSTSINTEEYREIRDLEPQEWESLALSATADTPLVILGLPTDDLPISGPHIYDRRGLSLAQSIEVVKDPRCQGYKGIDSCLSVVACQTIQDTNQITIRSRNTFWYENRRAFVSPHPYWSLGTLELA